MCFPGTCPVSAPPPHPTLPRVQPRRVSRPLCSLCLPHTHCSRQPPLALLPAAKLQLAPQVSVPLTPKVKFGFTFLIYFQPCRRLAEPGVRAPVSLLCSHTHGLRPTRCRTLHAAENKADNVHTLPMLTLWQGRHKVMATNKKCSNRMKKI